MPTPSSAGSSLGALLLSAFRPKASSGRDAIRHFAERFGGDTDEMGNNAMATRVGQKDPRLEGASREELAELDRFGQFEPVGRAGGLTTLPLTLAVSGGYEALAKNPTVGHLIAKVLNDPQFEVDETTSPPSMRNVIASLRGHLSGATGGKFGR